MTNDDQDLALGRFQRMKEEIEKERAALGTRIGSLGESLNDKYALSRKVVGIEPRYIDVLRQIIEDSEKLVAKARIANGHAEICGKPPIEIAILTPPKGI